MRKFQVVAAPGGFHACRRMVDGALLSIVECPTQEAAQDAAQRLNRLHEAADRRPALPEDFHANTLRASAPDAWMGRRPVRFFSDAEAV